MKFWKTFLKRLKGQTPTFFQKIRMFMAGILAAGLSLLPFKEEFPDYLKSLPAYLIIVGTLGTINNSLPIVDKKEIEEDAK